jgi:uncharacterized protein YdeI (YjbR/CyaY-like superfamily)
MSKLENAERMYFADRQALRTWFFKNHATATSFWLIYDKKNGAKRELTYDGIVEECLCFGFIDSVPRKISDTQSGIYISRRKKGSEWSKVNKLRIEKLQQAKLMTPQGQAVIDAAQKDGSWKKIDASENLEEPADFQRELKKSKKRRAHFDQLSPYARKWFLQRLGSAKTTATREKRMEFLMELLDLQIKPAELRLAFTKGKVPER